MQGEQKRKKERKETEWDRLKGGGRVSSRTIRGWITLTAQQVQVRVLQLYMGFTSLLSLQLSIAICVLKTQTINHNVNVTDSNLYQTNVFRCCHTHRPHYRYHYPIRAKSPEFQLFSTVIHHFHLLISSSCLNVNLLIVTSQLFTSCKSKPFYFTVCLCCLCTDIDLSSMA